jgi:NAD(P)H-dependent flavin oxidoreductase YrpB (nitropropane dioxygenase family)
MTAPFAELDLTLPVLAAPMAGGPTGPPMVIAAGRAGSLGFLAAGYKTPETVATEMAAVRAAGVPFGVNVFAPNPVPVDVDEFDRYARAIELEADRYGVDVRGAVPREDDDRWRDKIDLLLDDPVPVVSFTFGIPEPAVVAALRGVGTVVVQTVTSPAEAAVAVEAGVDVLAVQGSAAGGHSGTLTPAGPTAELVADVHRAVDRPLVAAGGVARPVDVVDAVRAGAAAVMVGTALLRAPESGASAAHQAAVADADRGDTVVTRAFTGRPARALRNRFVDRYDQEAPSGYPAIHHLTSPIRRAGTAAGDPEVVNLWAGTGYRLAAPDPVATTLERLAEDL